VREPKRYKRSNRMKAKVAVAQLRRQELAIVGVAQRYSAWRGVRGPASNEALRRGVNPVCRVNRKGKAQSKEQER